jgi:hypothetical protein
LDLKNVESVRDVVASMEIPNLYLLGAGRGFGYLIAPGNLVEVDLLDRRLFQAFQLVLDYVWHKKDLLLPIQWMLLIKL